LKFIDLKEWFPKLSGEDLVKIYGAFGGTPAYLEKIDEKISVEENIIRLILSRGGLYMMSLNIYLWRSLKYLIDTWIF